MNPVEHAGSVSNPKESGLMGLFNAAASAAGPGSAPSSPSVHIDGDPASGFGFAARPARPHMPHVHHGQHAHQVQRTPQGVVTPGVVAGDPMMGFQANARPSTPAESGDIGLPTTQRTTPLPQMLGQPGPGSTPLIDRHQGGAGFINPIDASGATAVSKDRPASGLAGMFSSAASSGGPAPSQLTNEMILDPAGALPLQPCPREI